MIAILDYGAGNLRSVENTLAELGCEYTLVRDAAGLRQASKIILPGVGHFGQMMRALDALDVRETSWTASAPACRSWASAWACRRCSRPARKRRRSAAWRFTPATVRRFPAGRARSAHGMERARSAPRFALAARPARAPVRLFRPQLLCAR